MQKQRKILAEEERLMSLYRDAITPWGSNLAMGFICFHLSQAIKLINFCLASVYSPKIF